MRSRCVCRLKITNPWACPYVDWCQSAAKHTTCSQARRDIQETLPRKHSRPFSSGGRSVLQYESCIVTSTRAAFISSGETFATLLSCTAEPLIACEICTATQQNLTAKLFAIVSFRLRSCYSRTYLQL